MNNLICDNTHRHNFHWEKVLRTSHGILMKLLYRNTICFQHTLIDGCRCDSILILWKQDMVCDCHIILNGMGKCFQYLFILFCIAYSDKQFILDCVIILDFGYIHIRNRLTDNISHMGHDLVQWCAILITFIQLIHVKGRSYILSRLLNSHTMIILIQLLHGI